MTEQEYQPKIIGFLCNWCSYAAADLAGTARMQYPQNIRIVRVPCSGRVDPKFILKAFLDAGVDGVLVVGCHPGDCHYGTGNYYARRRMAVFKRLLRFIGIEEERFHIAWASAAEGEEFAEIVKEFTQRLKALGKPLQLKRARIED
jgi:F420-non-reducing hydrogenase iron-sulfur subunit